MTIDVPIRKESLKKFFNRNKFLWQSNLILIANLNIIF